MENDLLTDIEGYLLTDMEDNLLSDIVFFGRLSFIKRKHTYRGEGGLKAVGLPI